MFRDIVYLRFALGCLPRAGSSRYFAVFLLGVLLAGCSVNSAQEQRPLAVLDNQGGFSHGGLRIELHEGGLACSMVYSDVIDERSVSQGTYELRGDVLKLRFENPEGKRTLHRVKYGGQIYWVSAQEVDKISFAEADYLRQISLRQQNLSSL